MTRRYFEGGRAPKRPPSQLVDLESRTFSLLSPVQKTGTVYFRDKDGAPVVLEKGAKILMSKHRPHWEQAPGCLVPLDRPRSSKGIYFIKGHGRV